MLYPSVKTEQVGSENLPWPFWNCRGYQWFAVGFSMLNTPATVSDHFLQFSSQTWPRNWVLGSASAFNNSLMPIVNPVQDLQSYRWRNNDLLLLLDPWRRLGGCMWQPISGCEFLTRDMKNSEIESQERHSQSLDSWRHFIKILSVPRSGTRGLWSVSMWTVTEVTRSRVHNLY